MEDMIDTKFIEKLSSSEPTPGGGGASAYCGAIAGACATFVANLTLNNKNFEKLSNQLETSIQRLNDAVSDLLILIETDADSFAPVAKAMKLPKGELRDKKLNESLIGACETPLQIMEKCLDVLDECEFLCHNGTKFAVSDIGCAAIMAKAALVSASLNVYINIKLFTNKDRASMFKDLTDDLIAQGVAAADRVYMTVAERIDGWRFV